MDTLLCGSTMLPHPLKAEACQHTASVVSISQSPAMYLLPSLPIPNLKSRIRSPSSKTYHIMISSTRTYLSLPSAFTLPFFSMSISSVPPTLHLLIWISKLIIYSSKNTSQVLHRVGLWHIHTEAITLHQRLPCVVWLWTTVTSV